MKENAIKSFESYNVQKHNKWFPPFLPRFLSRACIFREFVRRYICSTLKSWNYIIKYLLCLVYHFLKRLFFWFWQSYEFPFDIKYVKKYIHIMIVNHQNQYKSEIAKAAINNSKIFFINFSLTDKIINKVFHPH